MLRCCEVELGEGLAGLACSWRYIMAQSYEARILEAVDDFLWEVT